MKSDFIIALTQLAAERNLPREIVLSAIEAALASAYKRDSLAAGQNISVKLDPGSGDVSVFVVKNVVEDVEDPLVELNLKEAKKIKKDAAIGDVVPTEDLQHSAGRIAAQTAKQVVLQRLREAERDLVLQEYSEKEGEVFTVSVQKIESRQITVELGRAEAILPQTEQPPYERYRIGQKVKVVLQSIRESAKGPEIIVSRADKLLLRRLFEMEVPEIYNGSVEIIDIAREAGSRSKVAVFAKQDGIDAVGSCVGLRGIRIQNIVNELHGEKIDVVQWVKDPSAYISRALSPSLVMRVDLDESEQMATAVVPENQLSLAIGKEGQNARLAAKLTGWKVDIKSNVEIEEIDKLAASDVSEKETETETEEIAADLDVVSEEQVDISSEIESGEVVEVVQEEEIIEAPAAEIVDAEVDSTTEVEVVDGDKKSEDGTVDADPEILEDLVLQELISESESTERKAPVSKPETATSIEELPEEVWSVRNVPSAQPGVIRFREDITELAGSDGPRRTGKRKRKRGGAGQQNRRR